MNDLTANPLWRRDELDSPCVKICVIHPREGLCAGCYRTLDEIAQWSVMGGESRREILSQLPGRMGRLKKRRGGREGRLNES